MERQRINLSELEILDRPSPRRRRRRTGRSKPPVSSTEGDALQLIKEWKQAFRFNTFGDETFWGDALELHQTRAAGGGAGGVVYYGSQTGVGAIANSYSVTSRSAYTVTVGAGGAYGGYNNGINSSFGTLTAIGGGAGGWKASGLSNGVAGGRG